MTVCSVHLKAAGLKNEDLDDSKLEATTVLKIAKAVEKKLENEKTPKVVQPYYKNVQGYLPG